jgi:hypothetical protein
VNAAATWCAISPTFYAGNSAVAVSVAAQPMAIQRAATITFTAGTLTKTVTVAQAGAPLVLNVEPSTITATHLAGSYTVAVTSNAAWTATVSAGATWCTASPASGTGDGTVTVNIAENAASVTRSATVTIAAGSVNRTVAVAQAAKPATPPQYAASTQTWTFGSSTLVWSDAIRIPECDKNSFTDSWYEPHCRSYTYNNKKWYYYNWSYVNQNAEQLCPTPWRVPTAADFVNLLSSDATMQINVLWDRAGYYTCEYGWTQLGNYGLLWSQTLYETWGRYLLYTNTTYGNSVQYGGNQCGQQVRCVR